ncbi:MAG TPA: hypothetical protein VFS40_04460 [Gemmatimonadales bacterium]|nr:hypothetical protein [Gemmatimonadales bacterium]
MSTALDTRTSTGLAPNVAGLLAYLLGPITGVLFLVLEKENRFVRFHAAQSIAVSVALIVVNVAFGVFASVLAVVPVLGWLVALLAGLGLAAVGFVLWLVLMVRALGGREWEVPVVGAYARRYVPAGEVAA